MFIVESTEYPDGSGICSTVDGSALPFFRRPRIANPLCNIVAGGFGLGVVGGYYAHTEEEHRREMHGEPTPQPTNPIQWFGGATVISTTSATTGVLTAASVLDAFGAVCDFGDRDLQRW